MRPAWVDCTWDGNVPRRFPCYKISYSLNQTWWSLTQRQPNKDIALTNPPHDFYFFALPFPCTCWSSRWHVKLHCHVALSKPMKEQDLVTSSAILEFAPSWEWLLLPCFGLCLIWYTWSISKRCVVLRRDHSHHRFCAWPQFSGSSFAHCQPQNLHHLDVPSSIRVTFGDRQLGPVIVRFLG